LSAEKNVLSIDRQRGTSIIVGDSLTRAPDI
jgi:hypothetical protein